MDASLPPFNLFDALIIFAVFGTVLSACHRGLSREMLHTVMFAIMVGVGAVFMKNSGMPKSQEELTKFVISASFYLGAMYVLMWGGMKVLSPFILAPEHGLSFRSRFWAGALSIFKISSCIIGLNLWFAVHSPYAHPLRLEAFPQLVKDSLLVRLSDRQTDVFYRWLAENKVLDYNKFVEKPETPEEKDKSGLGSMLLGGSGDAAAALDGYENPTPLPRQ